MPGTQSPPPRRLEHLSSARLFVGDSLIALRLLNEARHRIMSLLFGMSREHSNLMTLFVLARSRERSSAPPRRRGPRCAKSDPAKPRSATR